MHGKEAESSKRIPLQRRRKPVTVYLIVIVYVREAGPDWKYHDRHSLAGRLQRRFCLSVTISVQISREFPHQRRKQQILTFFNLRCEKREHEEISFCFNGIG